MTTPYALFEHVPLSEIRKSWRVWHKPRRHDPRTGQRWHRWSEHIESIYCERALAAVTAERDALRRELDAMQGEL